MSFPAESSFIPLNDIREMKRSGSRNSHSDIDLAEEGQQDTVEYRIQAMCPAGKKKVSLWHDISFAFIDPET